ncbi:MAG: hypothetical protein WCF79_00780, partial [Rhodomicrobium sp.]
SPYEAAHQIPRIFAGRFLSRISIPKRTFHTTSARSARSAGLPRSVKINHLFCVTLLQEETRNAIFEKS